MVLALFAVSTVYGQWPTFRIFPSNATQIEPAIVTHPTNGNIMFAAAFTVSGTFSEGWYITTNGGLNWFGSDVMPGTNHGGDPGPIIDKNGRFIMCHAGVNHTSLHSNYTDNFGMNWSATITIASGTDIDKINATTDAIPSSSYYGRSYVVWTQFSGVVPIRIAWTTNGAESWNPSVQVNNSISGHSSLGPYVTIGPSGQVYIAWAATLQSSPQNEKYVGFGVSNNGGSTWTVQEQAYAMNGIKTQNFDGRNFRVNGYPYMDVDRTGGSRNGWIYIVTGEKNLAPAGTDADIVFHRSTNGGQTWSAGIRVNQDALNNGKVQYFPAIEVDAGGALNVVYFDNRNATGQNMGVFLSRSIDGGDTWSDYQVNDHWFIPGPAGGLGGNQGDNIGITSGNGKLWPAWMDNSSGSYQVWTAGIEIATIGIKQIGFDVPESFALGQNYPNPFNQSSIINFQLSINSAVNIKVYDSKGAEVKALYDGELKAGVYEVQFDGSNLPSGVYFYRLSTPEFSETKKMILTK